MKIKIKNRMIKTNKKENEKFMNPPSIFLDFFR
jgi:hypothetical protein